MIFLSFVYVIQKNLSTYKYLQEAFDFEKILFPGVQPPIHERIAIPKLSSNNDRDTMVLQQLMQGTTKMDKINSLPPSEKKQENMNIILFYGDDWRYDSLGIVNKHVKTPFLDALAREGVLFTQNAVTTSICWISRACLATGQHYARHKTMKREPPVPFHKHWNETMFAQLINNGYFTASVGKWQPSKMDDGMFNYSTIYEGFHYKEEEHITDMNVLDALHFLQNERKGVDDPFALFVNFFAPHAEDNNPEQYLPQKLTRILYNETDIPFGPTATEESWNKLPFFLDENEEGRKRWRKRFDEPIKAQKMLKNYFRLITGVDFACGRILEELKRQNETENTLIIFTTDNGYYLSDHGLADKWYAHQESIRVPLIIKDPRMNKNLIGTMNDAMTLSIDLAPTILQAAGITPPERMQGDDISKLYTGDIIAGDKHWRREFYYEYPTITTIAHIKHVQALVRKDYKYILWPAYKVEELFHLPSDPYEENDLVKSIDPKYEKILEDLRIEFRRVQKNAA